MTLPQAVASIVSFPYPERIVWSNGSRSEECGSFLPSDVDLGAVRSQLVDWLTLVQEWNRKVDLTAARTPEALAEVGVLDAWQLAGRVGRAVNTESDQRPLRVVDVGCGFGPPGLPLAILRPDLRVTLVESLGKRVAFLRSVVGALSLVDRVEIVHSKGERLAEGAPEFDVAISRATLNPTLWLDLGDRLCPRGEVIVFLAKEAIPSHPHRRLDWTASYSTQANAERHLASYCRSR